MPIELTMPALSPTMEKGTLAKWLVKEGDRIRSGDLIAEIETDKATMEFEAIDNGTIASLVVAEGTDDVAVGTVIALIAAEDEVFEAIASPNGKANGGPAPTEKTLSPAPDAEAAAGDASSSPSVAVASAALPAPPERDFEVSPLARRIAAARGITLDDVAGSGPRGKILKADLVPAATTELVLAAAGDMPAATSRKAGPVAAYPPPIGIPFSTDKLSNMRKTIARRLVYSKQNIPHFYLTVRCRLDALLDLRVHLNATLRSDRAKISVNDMLIRAMGQAMLAVPETNVQFADGELFRFGRVDIAMAVAIDGGLVTPVITDAGSLSVSAIAERSKALAAKAREGRLVPDDYEGGTASISNLGMFGIDEMFPVINPPQALILGVGAGIEQPWKVDGQLALATILAATASFDHRAVDGAAAARFMSSFRGFVENPLTMVA